MPSRRSARHRNQHEGCVCVSACVHYFPCLRRIFLMRLRYLCLFIFFLLFFKTLLQVAAGSEVPGNQGSGRGSKCLVCHAHLGGRGPASNVGPLYDVGVGWAHVRHHRDLAGRSGKEGGAQLLSYLPVTLVDALRSKCPCHHFGDLFSSCCDLDPSTYSGRNITTTPTTADHAL